MELVDGKQIQYQLLRGVYRLAPFDLKGDFQTRLTQPTRAISCLIIASYRPRELEALLEDLADQDLDKKDFEVIVLNDGAGDPVRRVVEKFKGRLIMGYQENAAPKKVLSNLRNATLELACGQYVLLLDDDTRLMRKDFLSQGLGLLKAGTVDVLLPKAQALYGLVRHKYDFLDSFSMTNRCCFYRREILEELGGFKKDLNTYEDIELSIRVRIKDFRVYRSAELEYFHPPLFFESMQKPLAIGQTIFQMRKHYSLLVWLLVYVNALRFLPYGLVPQRVCRQWFKISLGVLWYPFTGRTYTY